MTRDSRIDARYTSCHATLTSRGQHNVLRYWAELSPADREQLLDDIESVPWDVLDPLMDTHVRALPQPAPVANLSPPDVHPAAPGPDRVDEYRDARRQGEELIRAGKVAALTVAGGQGSRLGFDGPKGIVPVTPVGDLTLFQLFAGAVLATRKRYEAVVAWYIMTSPANHAETVAYFETNAFFGLPRQDVIFFAQGTLPAFDFEGRLLLAEKHRLALAPDGHGGTLKALVASGNLGDMQDRGVQTISYFQVDNPLVNAIDPLFIGLHASTQSEMAIKVTPKVSDTERVGNVCMLDGKATVIEYSEFPAAYAAARNEGGIRKFNAGNLAIHLFDVGFVDRVVGQTFQLPFRRAEKIVSCVDDTGKARTPNEPNAIKLETFVFDVLPLANNPLVLEVERSEEFSPVKNADGTDSLVSSRRDQNARACRWLEAASVTIPRCPDGQPDVTITIAPSFALDAAELREKATDILAIQPGDDVLLR